MRIGSAFLVLGLIGGAASLTACGKSGPERMVAIYEDLADTVDSNKDDCAKLADKMRSWKESNIAALTKARDETMDLNAKMPEEEKKALKEKLNPRMSGARQKTRAAMEKCGKDEKVRAALKDIPEP